MSLLVQLEDYLRENNPRDIYWVHVLERLKPNIEQISEALTHSVQSYKQVEWLPNSSLITQKNQLIDELQNWQWMLQKILENYDTLLSILWKQERKQYLIVFQNADEIRPSWGFMWSMALVSMFRGKVDVFQKKDVYAIEWDLKLADYERRPAPKGINELTEYFWLRDANYFINTRDSAEAIEFFVSQAWLDIDGVVFLNQNSLVRLLEITGPVYFDTLKRDITAYNFSEIMSLLVESKVFDTGTLWTPKQILFDFVPVFFQTLKQQAQYWTYAQFLFQEISRREIVLWLFDTEEQALITELWLDGAVDTSQSLDFWYPVYTSISGNKSDRYMKRAYRYSVTKDSSCAFEVQGDIQSTHAMTKVHRDQIETFKADFDLEPDEELMYIQWTGRNRQYVRYLIPSEATDIELDSGEIVDYGSRKWLEFFLETPLLQTSRYSFSYTLPNPDCKPYTFTHYKQPWLKNYDIDFIYNDALERSNDMNWDFYFEK